jgi:hypothetical protein
MISQFLDLLIKMRIPLSPIIPQGFPGAAGAKGDQGPLGPAGSPR